MLLVILLFSTWVVFALQGEIENGIVGEPQVRCGPESIAILAKTMAPFRGRVYVDGEADNPECSARSKQVGAEHGKIEFGLRYGLCRMKRERTLSPRGVTYSLTVIVSFHPIFVTSTDRGFTLRCFFLESVKNIETAVDVRQLTTELITQEFTLPTCTYRMKQGTPDGPPVKYARVGDPVVHIWSCNSEAADAYGLLIHSCFVDDGRGNRFNLIDNQGCTMDAALLAHTFYQKDRLSAYAHSKLFKFADKIQVFFSCTVQLCFRSDGGCDGISPPTCNGHPAPFHSDEPSSEELPDMHSDTPPRQDERGRARPFLNDFDHLPRRDPLREPTLKDTPISPDADFTEPSHANHSSMDLSDNSQGIQRKLASLSSLASSHTENASPFFATTQRDISEGSKEMEESSSHLPRSHSESDSSHVLDDTFVTVRSSPWYRTDFSSSTHSALQEWRRERSLHPKNSSTSIPLMPRSPSLEKRRRLNRDMPPEKMETDLSVDVIVFPLPQTSQPESPAAAESPLNPPPSLLCFSRLLWSLSLAVCVSAALFVSVVSFIVGKKRGKRCRQSSPPSATDHFF